MADAPDAHHLERRLHVVEERLSIHVALLEAHTRQLDTLREAVRDMRVSADALSAQVGRLSDAATTQGLCLERIERLLTGLASKGGC